MATEIRVWGEGRQGLWSFGQSVDIPEDYEEVPTGDPYLTRRIKELSETVYVRMCKVYKKRPSAPVAILAPREIVEAVRADAARTAESRAASRDKAAVTRARKEDRGRDAALAELKAMLPGIPAEEAEHVIERAFEVGSGRVGRTRQASLNKKLELAVRAHIRHTHTQYDELLLMGWDREDARSAVRHQVDAVYDGLAPPILRLGRDPARRRPGGGAAAGGAGMG